LIACFVMTYCSDGPAWHRWIYSGTAITCCKFCLL